MYRLWKTGAAGTEYFLVENRQRTLYDRKLPGAGLLVYHVDEAIEGNEDENHPQVKLLEADGLRHLHTGANRGDTGDAYPGSAKNVSLTNVSSPDSNAYGGIDACVRITNIVVSGTGVKARIGVKCTGGSAPVRGSSKKGRSGAARRPSRKAAGPARRPARTPATARSTRGRKR